jgi:hypothetical protein
MDELVKLVVEKTGLPEETAQKAVETVLDFVKEKLPEPIADRLDDILEGGGAADLLGGLGGLFGN